MPWHILVWLPVALVFGAWCLFCIALHALLGAVDWAAPAGWLTWLEQWQFPMWLAPWLPMDSITWLKTWLTQLGPMIQDTSLHFPALLGWLQVGVWVVWGLGLLLLLVLGSAGSLAVQAIRRS